MHAPPSVLSVINHGYCLPFSSEPESFWRPNHPSASRFESFVDEELARLLAEGAVAEAPVCPPGVCALGVDDSRGKLRLIHDGRPLSPSLRLDKFRYESLATALTLLRPGDKMVQFDLSKAYHHVRVWSGHWGWLGMQWRGRFYVCCVLPFGLASAPFAFTKFTRPVVRFLRERGVRVTLYLDDGLVMMAPDQLSQVALVRATLRRSGLLVNEAKSNWDPSAHVPAFLGFAIDAERGVLTVKASRATKLAESLAVAARTPRPTRRQLASVAGQLAAMSVAVGVRVRLMTRGLYALVGDPRGRAGWDRRVDWTDDARAELAYWIAFIDGGGLRTGKQIWPPSQVATVVLSTDASDVGCGMVLRRIGGGAELASFTPLTTTERLTSSTYRELRALTAALSTFGPQLRAETTLWRVDNAAAAIIVLNGSRVPPLQRLALQAAELCAASEVTLCPQWVPRDLNTEADEWSRRVDRADFTLRATTLRCVATDAWDLEPAFDLFADEVNSHCSHFYSGRPCPGSAGIDALVLPWPAAVTLYAFPPIPLVGRLLRRLFASPPSPGQPLLLVLPVWPSQPWWPLLAPDGVHAVHQVARWHRLSRADFVAGPSGAPAFLTHPEHSFAFAIFEWVHRSRAPPVAGRLFCRLRFAGRPCATCAG